MLYIYRCYFSKSAFSIKMKINLKLSFKIAKIDKDTSNGNYHDIILINIILLR